MLIRAIIRFLPESMQGILKKEWRKLGFAQRTRKKKAVQILKKKESAIAKYGVFNDAELCKVLKDMGIQEGDILFVQTSFNDLYTLDTTPMELIKALRSSVGTTGTLLMPAYTAPPNDTNWIYDPVRESTYTGIVNEIFRRLPGVIRSLHPRHSIAGIGPHAESILSNHEKCIRADGEHSPFDKLRYLNNAKILTLGLPVGFVSFLHWVEDLDPGRLPFPVHERSPRIYQYRVDHSRIEKIEDYRVQRKISRLVDYPRIAQYLSASAMLYRDYKGIKIGLYPLDRLSQELILLRDRGVIHYFKRGYWL